MNLKRPRFTSVLINMTMTAIEMITAMTMPITTRGIAPRFRPSKNAIIRPVQTTLVMARYVASTSAALDLCGRRANKEARSAHSMIRIATTCTPPFA